MIKMNAIFNWGRGVLKFSLNPPRAKFLLVFLFCLLVPSQAFAEKARVRYVIDGDTFILEDQQRVRMIGINAPEVYNRTHRHQGEPYGKDAKRSLVRLIEGQEVDLRAGAEPFDRFGRRLAYVYLDDGTFVNRKLVEDGQAETFRKFPFEYRDEFLALEQNAKREGKGMWSKAPKPWKELLKDYIYDLWES